MTNNVPPQLNGNKVSSEETVFAESGKLIKLQLQKESDRDRQSSKKPKVDFKTLAKVLAISIIPLAVLAIEVTTYYHASQSSFKQIDDRESTEPKPLELLIPILLMGVGATVSGALAALWINRILNSTKTNKKTTQEAKIRQELTEQIQLLTKAAEKIRNALTQEDIFQIAVQEARKAISADRVLVYSLNEQSEGEVIAESVDYLYPQALGAIIDDPCFSIHYLEKYQNGRVKATDDIYQANLTACHISQLEPFAVKANLVTPILNRGKLIGLLIAHHCAAPHVWQQSEIDVMTQIATQIGLTLDNIELLTTSADLRQQKETETRRIQSLTKATDHIRASLNQEDILQTAVQEARKAISADRVVVYSLDEQSQGEVIAESVDARYPQALGANIDDPCFNAYYLEQYQNGRVKATNDIYQANLTACHISQLEPFAVKANLVTPILNRGKLIGLLIAHHCAAPHVWQQSEIDVMTQIATQIGLTLDNIELLTTSADLRQQKETETRRIQSLTKATDHIRASLNQEDILQTAVQEARKAISADRVVVYSLDEQSQGKMIAESVDSRYPQSLGVIIDDPCFSTFYLEKYQNGRVKATNDIYQANLTPCHLAQLEPFAVKANLVVPILTKGKIIGLLIAHHCSAPHVWQQSEIDVMTQIAKQIGFAIDNVSLLSEVSQLSQTFLKQLPSVTNFAQAAIANARQAQIQVQQTSQTIKSGSEVASQTVYDFSNIQGDLDQTITRIGHLAQSSQKISQLVNFIDHLATQINLQGMNMLIQASKTDDISHNPAASPLSQTMESLRGDLAEAKAEIQSFVGKIETEVQDLSTAIKSRTEKVVKGTDLAEKTRQKLDQIDTVTSQMNVLLSNIISAAEKVQTSTSASQAMLGTKSLVPQNSEQSQVFSNSLNQLMEASLSYPQNKDIHSEDIQENRE